MKKIFIAIICGLFSITLSAQNIDEILAKYETANGGKEAFTAVKTLQYNTVLKMNMMGMPIDINISNIIDNGKLYRKEISGMMGMKGSYTLVTDTAGYTSTPTIPSYGDFQGMEGGIKKMDKDALQKLQPKLNPMQEFATLIDLKSKGSKAELQGTTKIEKVECYKIKVTPTTGDASIYYIDITTSLTKQVELSGKQIASMFGLDSGGPMAEMMGGRMDKQKMTVIYSEYRDINGIKFPTKQKIQLGAVDIEIENNDVEINQTIDAKWYKIN